MTPELERLKYLLHAARVALDYQKKTTRPERDGSRAQQIAEAEARLKEAEAAYYSAKPEPVALNVRSKYFIGPKRKRPLRCAHSDATCIKCEKFKPADQFPTPTGVVCSACSLEKSTEWGRRNPEKAKDVKRAWDKRNRERLNAAAREKYKQTPIEMHRERARKFRSIDKNRLKSNAWTREYLRNKKKTDHKWRAFLTCRRRMWILFKSAGIKKNTRSVALLGIDREGFFAHIESLWLPGMTWENRGRWGWHIDHIKPCSLFDMTDPEQAKACWHYTNLQPLWWRDNLRKGDRYTPDKKAG